MKIHGKLTVENIEHSVSSGEKFAKKWGAAKIDCLKVRLMTEEMLIIYKEAFGENSEFVFIMRKDPETIVYKLSVKGASLDPTSKKNSLNEVLSLFDIDDKHQISWQYIRNSNHISFSVPIHTTPLKNIKFAWKYVKRHRRSFIIAVISQLINVMMNIALPMASAKVIVSYTDKVLEQILLTALSLFAVSVIADISIYFCNIYYNRVYNGILTDLEVDLVDSAMQIKSACIEHEGAGLFIQRLTSDTTNLATSFNVMADELSQIFHYLGILIAVLIISPPIFVFVFMMVTTKTVIELIRTKKMYADDNIFRQSNERVSGLISEMVRGSNDIKILNSENNFHDEISKRIKIANQNHINMSHRSWRYKFARWIFGDFAIIIFILLVAMSILKFGMAPATAVVLFNFYTELNGGASLLLGEFLEFKKGFELSADRICALIYSPEFPKEEFGDKKLHNVKGEVHFDHVSFHYDSFDPRFTPRQILKDMSFVIPAGSTVAFVGKSGCGKSTILRLLTKLNVVNEGTIYLDGEDINTLDKESLRGNIAFVSQSPYLFHLSFRDNLLLIKPDMTDEEMHRVCEMACIADDIEAMPLKYDSIIGEGGITLSGGQKQRIAIARCLLKNCGIILLDEATSALDNTTQLKIQQAINNVKQNRTIIMIAHRLSTVINSDIIFFVEDGKILSQGTHAELLEKCEEYRVLFHAEATNV
ncbi:ABC transporter ATP-binding protein [Butyrivibrio sp. JL13D10]|uniref:ABC transporter ATP-binding protein n=1 Tax=Butyrivibrio sp. JL13D10 TaxID=3236815 RepID=UPI0038B57410